ncbi:hypothetical protein CC117_05905 [Parafrankia colletiae]|uniref:Asp23/Gls24 family envelope stress response protein n=1 Tax=Parafrankia colletiae TaxID=573497 RepID=A0A1S1QEJ9_9ACTN|nr:hypothetical protein CC117_05905 [Parafrankia colletiae]
MVAAADGHARPDVDVVVDAEGDGEMAVAVARQVTACPDVVRLVGHPARYGTGWDGHGYGHGGGPRGAGGAGGAGELATYVGGRRIEGVRVGPDAVVVAVACRFGPTMAELAAQVRAAVLIAMPTAPRIDVIIDDLEVDIPAWAGVT